MTTNIKALADRVKELVNGNAYEVTEFEDQIEVIEAAETLASALLRVLEDAENMSRTLDSIKKAALKCDNLNVLDTTDLAMFAGKALESHNKLMEELGGEKTNP